MTIAGTDASLPPPTVMEDDMKSNDNSRNEDIDTVEAKMLRAGFEAFDQRVVYIKPTDSSLIQGLDGIPAGTIVYAVHLADGTPVAVMGDRSTAFSMARQYNMVPMSVH
ncbi:MAG TPA: hypothetical protein DDW95_05180 [Alphaproteobacteria bacterium]|nr:hypothetical protein [Alphaproteobacteria bacterium]